MELLTFHAVFFRASPLDDSQISADTQVHDITLIFKRLFCDDEIRIPVDMYRLREENRSMHDEVTKMIREHYKGTQGVYIP